MFFDRSGLPSHLSRLQKVASLTLKKNRRAAALGLAVAMAAPSLLARSASAEEATPATTPLGAVESLKLGASLLDQRQYEQAALVLDKIHTIELTDAQHTDLAKLKAEIQRALDQRHLANLEYKQGLEAQQNGRMVEARALFDAAANNRFADAQTVASARSATGEKVVTAVADAPAADASNDSKPADEKLSPRDHYQKGLKEYRAGDWENARKDFEASRGYKPGLFDGDRPETYLARMDKKEKADREETIRRTQASSHTVGGGALMQEGGAPTTAPTQPDNQAMDVLRNTSRADDLRRQQNIFQAQQLVQKASDETQAGKLEDAARDYGEALRLDPNNAQARAGQNDVLARLGRAPQTGPGLTEVARDIETRRQEIRYRFSTSINEANTASREHRFADALVALQRAQLAANTDRSIFNAQELREFDQTYATTRADVERAQQLWIEDQRRRGIQGASEDLQRQRDQAERERRHTIADLKATARTLTEQARYAEALSVVDQILTLDSTDEYAIGVRPLLEDKVMFQKQRVFIEDRERNKAHQWNAAEEKMVPYNDILRYPTDWPDLSATRDQTVAGEQHDNREDRAAQAQLERPLPELNFEGVAFSDVMDFLRDVSGANIFVNWKALETAGIDRTAPVTLKLRNIKFSKALTLILNNVGGGTVALGYTIDEGVISISTQDELAKNTITRVYDIRDLIINIPDFTDAPNFDLNSISNQSQQQGGAGGGGVGGGGVGGGGGSGSQQGLFGGSYGGGSSGAGGNREGPGPTRQELVDQITKLVTDTVQSDSWRDNGGNVGSLRELQGQLIVTQTPENQHSLMNLLEQLREQRAIQVTVETRFLTIQRNFLEDVGLDLNFIFNLNSAWSNKLSTIAVNNPSSSFTQGPITSVPGTIGNTASSLTTSATYLDDFQVQLLLRATQAQQTSTIVQAPRLTLYNGQRAYVVVAVSQAYVSNLTAAVGTGVSAFQPTIGFAQSGVELDVVATVSADRKYVTLTLRPELANLLDLKSFTFQTGTSGAANGGINNNVVNSPSGTIQEPEIQITEVKTTVTVPDGGTLLLGGQTVAGEIEKEVGVPVLSKIPFLKRLFTNRSMAKDEQVLLILVKPTILITREIEQKQFPLLSSKLGA